MTTQLISVPFITGETENGMEVVNYNLYKDYADIIEGIQIILKDSVVVYGNKMTSFVGDGLTVESVERTPIVIVGKRIIPEVEILILLHEAIHAAQHRTRKLCSWNGDYIEWNGKETQKPVWIGQKALENNKDLALAYLNLPWEREAWMITAVIGGRMLPRIREKYKFNADLLSRSGIHNFTGAPLRDGLTKLYGYDCTADFKDAAEQIYAEYMRA